MGEAGGINLYDYVGNNPVNYVDPLGLQSWMGAGYGALSGPLSGGYSGSPGISIFHGTPPNSQTFTAPNGQTFLAPAGTDFQLEYNAGQSNGWNPFGIDNAIGHYGTFDYQRNRGQGRCPTNTFYPAYTDASNYGVGVYMNGAGFSLNETMDIGNLFAGLMSANAGAASQQQWWSNGWSAAQSGNPNGLTAPKH